MDTDGELDYISQPPLQGSVVTWVSPRERELSSGTLRIQCVFLPKARIRTLPGPEAACASFLPSLKGNYSPDFAITTFWLFIYLSVHS